MGAASITTSGLGAFMGAVNSFATARNEKSAANANATQADYAAADAQYRGNLELQKVQRAGEQVKGAQRAHFGAAGVDLTEGSPLAILTDTDYFNALDQNTVKDNTAKEVYGFRVAGANYRSQANAINPWLSAGTSALAGAGQVADRWNYMKAVGITPAFRKQK